MALKCDGCKAYCCRLIGKVMPELDDGSGSCLYLKDNKCQIYDHRPEICDTDRLYERYFVGKMTKEEWVELNRKSCQDLKAQFEEV